MTQRDDEQGQQQEPQGQQPTIYIDADPWNRDWLHTTWPLPCDNAKDPRAFLARCGLTVERYKRLRWYWGNVDTPGNEWLRDL